MERTYVFNQDGGTGAKQWSACVHSSVLAEPGIDTGYLMGADGEENGNGGFFGNNGGFQDIMHLIVIAAIFGNGELRIWWQQQPRSERRKRNDHADT